MPSKKPNEKRIEFVKTKFKVIESKTLNLEKEQFFKLPYSTALEAVDADLSKTAYRLWIYLSANYPFSDRDVDLPSQTELAIRLNVSRQAVNIAAAELQATGLWDFWSEKWKGRNLRGYSSSTSEDVNEKRQVSKKDDTLSKKDDTGCQQKSTRCRKKMTPSQLSSTPTPPEPLQSNDSSTIQTIQTYTDFRKTLSDEERESFLNFCEEKAKNLSQEVNDIEAWLAHTNKAGQNRWEVYYDLFRKSQPELVHRQQNAEWENHLRRDEWLTEIESTSNPAMFAGSDKEKQDFVSWCWKTKQFSWLKEEVEDGI